MAKATGKNEIQVIEEKAKGVDLTKFRIMKRVVVPTISIKDMKEGDSIAFRAESEIKYVDQVDEKTGELKTDKKTGEPSKLPVLHVTKLDTGEYGQIVLPAIAHRGLSDEGELIGRMFAMQKGRSLGTGKANVWDVVEICEG